VVGENAFGFQRGLRECGYVMLGTIAQRKFGLNTALAAADTSQQPLLTAPQHA
jgi:hypothetical protein